MLSPHELLQIALNIEIDGKLYYERLSNSATNEPVRAVFRLLKIQEEEHAVFFRQLLKEYEEESFELINWDDSSIYLKSLTEGKIFPEPHSIMTKYRDSNIDDAIEYAVEIEEKTLTFYDFLLGLCSSKETSVSIERIIEEERNHILLLKGLR